MGCEQSKGRFCFSSPRSGRDPAPTYLDPMSGFLSSETAPEDMPVKSASALPNGEVNLSGRWIFVGYEGNMNFLMLDLGFSAKEAMEAEKGDFGIRKRELIIDQRGNDVALSVKHPSGRTISQQFTVGCRSQHTLGLHGEPCTVDTAWVGRGRTLSVQSAPVEKQSHVEPMRQYYKDGHQLVCLLSSEYGRSVKHYYTPVDKIGDFVNAMNSTSRMH